RNKERISMWRNALVCLIAASLCCAQKKTAVCCIGGGYVGATTGAIIADKCPGAVVYIVDKDEEKIKKWNSEVLPIYEEGLKDIVHRRRDKNLFFITDAKKAIESSRIIFLCVNTPTKNHGIGSGESYDMSFTELAVREIMKHTDGKKIVVEKSTVPCKTAENIKDLIEKSGFSEKITVLSNPEFLAQGTAVRDLLNPDRVLIGCFPEPAGWGAQEELREIYASWVPEEKILSAKIWTSELAKLAANAFLSQRVSSINALSSLCERVGADIVELSEAVGMDSRIGNDFLSAGLGFGGSCFEKDIRCLIYLCGYYNLKEEADYWSGIIRINDHQKKRFVQTIFERMFSTLSNKKVAVLGFAFKKGTFDTRKTPAADIVKGLMKENTCVHLYDPMVKAEDVYAELGMTKEETPGLSISKSVEEACLKADAVVISTDWDCFKDIDFAAIREGMNNPAFLFDGKNLFDPAELREAGFVVYSVGRG
ncbi:MAG: UDP-glucose 6-dehydrogenase, partial [Amphiamblys sp. WSBS2006]